MSPSSVLTLDSRKLLHPNKPPLGSGNHVASRAHFDQLQQLQHMPVISSFDIAETRWKPRGQQGWMSLGWLQVNVCRYPRFSLSLQPQCVPRSHQGLNNQLPPRSHVLRQDQFHTKYIFLNYSMRSATSAFVSSSSSSRGSTIIIARIEPTVHHPTHRHFSWLSANPSQTARRRNQSALHALQ